MCVSMWLKIINNVQQAWKKEADKKLRCNGVRALVVDDESMNLVVAKSIFRRYGMKVVTATSGSTGWISSPRGHVLQKSGAAQP